MNVLCRKWRLRAELAEREVVTLHNEIASVTTARASEAERAAKEIAALRDQLAHMESERTSQAERAAQQIAALRATVVDLQAQSLRAGDLADLRRRHAVLFAENERLSALLRDRTPESSPTTSAPPDSRVGGPAPE